MERKLQSAKRMTTVSVPKEVLKHLGLCAGDSLKFEILRNGKVVISKGGNFEEEK